MYGYNQQNNIEKLNQQIRDLQTLRDNYQNPQPMNVFNVGNQPTIDFEARYLKENEKVDEILVQRKTAFIDLKGKSLSIKEIDGTIITYEIVLPKDEKDLKIEELEKRLKDYEQLITTNNKKSKSNDDVKE